MSIPGPTTGSAAMTGTPAMTGTAAHVVIVGNGIAGQTAAHALRDLGHQGPITLIGEETHKVYSRPALSKAALAPGADLTSHALADATHQARELTGRPAAGLDLAGRRVLLADGSEVGYDALVIATGSGARSLTDSEHEVRLRTMDDALALQQRLTAAEDVLVAGGGPLGLEVAAGAAAHGHRVTVVSRGLPMAGHLGEWLASRLNQAALRAGVSFVDGRVSGAEADATRARVRLEDGRTLEAGLLVSAIGDDPHVAWLETSGLLHDGRLCTDSRGRVLAPGSTEPLAGVVAAGDVAHWQSPEGPTRSPLWTSAIEQAKVAARTLLLGEESSPLDFVPYFWTEQFGITLRVMGQLPAIGEPVEVKTKDDDPERLLATWPGSDGRPGTVAALNFPMAIPKLRALAVAAGAPAAHA